MSPGHWVGELALRARSQGRDTRRSFSVVASTPMTIAVFSQQEYNELVRVSPVIAERIATEAGIRERRTNRLVSEAAVAAVEVVDA